MSTRIESDSMGEIEVEASRYWGAQTQRSIGNFPIGRDRFVWGRPIIEAFGLVKKAAALANASLGTLDRELASSIVGASAMSMTSTNMKAPMNSRRSLHENVSHLKEVARGKSTRIPRASSRCVRASVCAACSACAQESCKPVRHLTCCSRLPSTHSPGGLNPQKTALLRRRFIHLAQHSYHHLFEHGKLGRVSLDELLVAESVALVVVEVPVVGPVVVVPVVLALPARAYIPELTIQPSLR